MVLPDGQHLHVRDDGCGPPLIFIHGLPGLASDFGPLTKALSDTVRCISYDRAGYGQSTPAVRHRPIGIDANVADLAALMDGLQIQRAALVGWSYGGAVALTAAAQLPDRVDQVILLGSAGPALRFPVSFADYLLFRTPFGKLIIRILRALGPSAFRGPLNEAYGTRAPDHVVQAFWTSLGRPGAVSQWLREGVCWDPLEIPLAEVHQPCLILHGDSDTRVPYSVAQHLAAGLLQAKLIEIPGAGHWPFATHTGLVRDHIIRFLATQ